MSEQNVTTLEAGRALDVAVARALGHEVYSADGEQFLPDYGWMVNGYPVRVPHYSTDLNAAFSLWNSTPSRSVRLVIIPAVVNEYWVQYSTDAEHYVPGSGSYYPLAEAVCRCWLVWKAAHDDTTL